ncbi:MAG: TatD family hydrolase [Lishizhenia sp.]
MFIDTHTHMFSEKFQEDTDTCIQNAINSGVEKMLLPNIDIESIDAMHALEIKYPKHCFSMMGLHPCAVQDDFEKKLVTVKEHLFSRDYIAVGEIGIDLYWDKTYLEEQKHAFKQQCIWAKELGIPIAIHARSSFDEIFECLDEVNDEKLTGVLHCFTGSQEQAQQVLAYGGFKLGIGGVVTFKKAGLDKVVQTLTLNDIVLETDAPYLAPTPFRGKRNESSYLLHVAEKVAEIFELPLKEVEEQTTLNALELFSKLKQYENR